MIERMIRAARLDVSLYEEVERDLNATTQAFMAVLIVSVLSGVGAALTFLTRPGQAISSLVMGIVAAVVGWIVWSFVTYWIGTRVFNGTATPGELLRTIGFAYTPNALGFFVFIPCLGGFAALIGAIWALVAGVVAVRSALDFDTGKALLTVLLGWIALVVISLILSAIGLGFLMRL